MCDLLTSPSVPPRGQSLVLGLPRSALTAKKLDGVSTGSSSQPARQGIDDLLLLGHGETDDRHVRHDVSTHRVGRVLRREHRVRSSLPEVNACRPSRPLTISRRDGQLQIAVVLTIDGAILIRGDARKRVRHSVDSQGLRIGEQGMTPAGVVNRSAAPLDVGRRRLGWMQACKNLVAELLSLSLLLL